ncbi:MAG TPA: polysaccharide deacetylase family protein [Blastocatellia bacterium]|nr:polysaccharide deacetylase family protein [Blastocatellia bacterium]
MRKKELAAAILGRGVSRILLRGKGHPDSLPILAYHRILDDDPSQFQFDEQLISANSPSFRKQMAFVRDSFETVSFEDLHRHEIEGRPWPRRALIITFDDGYRDNYTNAFPILREFGLKATVFLATGHVGQSKLFWWDRVAYLVKHTKQASVAFPGKSDACLSLNGLASRRFAIDRMLAWLKKAPEDSKNQYLATLPSLLKLRVPKQTANRMHVGWDEVREMAKGGIEFGSHTVTHPILANVGERQLEVELLESKLKIEAEVGKDVLAFAYPVGGRSFGGRTQEIVSRCGYRFAVSYIDGLARRAVGARYALPRIHVETGHSLDFFRASLSFPRIMCR